MTRQLAQATTLAPRPRPRHTLQLWPALRTEVLAPASPAALAAPGLGAQAGAPASGGGGDADDVLSLSAAAASCLTLVARAAGPGAIEPVALQVKHRDQRGRKGGLGIKNARPWQDGFSWSVRMEEGGYRAHGYGVQLGSSRLPFGILL